MDRPIVLAHRGARRVAPENTVAAFAAARALGADGVELDVRRTRDGALVIRHDPALGAGPVLATVDFAELRAMAPGLATLDEALDECRGLLVNVEVKNLPWEPDFDEREAVAEAVVGRLAARGGADRVLVSSFHLPTVDRVRDAGLPTGLLVVPAADLHQMVDLAAERGHSAVHPEVGALHDREADAVVAHARDRGLGVNVWTVNEPDDVVWLAALGVDAIITDVPDVVIAVLDQAGSTNDSASGS